MQSSQCIPIRFPLHFAFIRAIVLSSMLFSLQNILIQSYFTWPMIDLCALYFNRIQFNWFLFHCNHLIILNSLIIIFQFNLIQFNRILDYLCLYCITFQSIGLGLIYSIQFNFALLTIIQSNSFLYYKIFRKIFHQTLFFYTIHGIWFYFYHHSTYFARSIYSIFFIDTFNMNT